jgi:dUTP pyrophosphatase
MIDKQDYERGIRCKGMCGFCSDKTVCYQGIKWIEEYGNNSSIDLQAQLMQETIEEALKPKRLRGFEFVSMDQGLKDFEVDITKVELKLPKRGTSKSAGYDIFAPYDITLQPNEEINVPTGLKAYMQDGEVLMAFPRSGLGFKYYCRLANTVGVIDSDYYNNPKNEGHMFVKLRNEGTKEMTIEQGDGMCQMIFMPFLLVDGDSFDEGEKRKGGFGSTTGGNK